MPNDALTVVFAVQRSQFGRELWYYGFGIALHALSQAPVTSISGCQIRDRVEMKSSAGVLLTPDEILHLTAFRTRKYGDLRKLRIRAVQNQLPRMTELRAVTFLTQGGMPL